MGDKRQSAVSAEAAVVGDEVEGPGLFPLMASGTRVLRTTPADCGGDPDPHRISIGRLVRRVKQLVSGAEVQEANATSGVLGETGQVARYGDAQWFAALAKALDADRSLEEYPDVSFTLRQLVIGGPDGDVDFVVRFAGGRVGLLEETNAMTQADVEIHSSWLIAAAIAAGTLTPGLAFGAGRMRLAGDISLLIRNGPMLRAVAAATRSLASTTTW